LLVVIATVKASYHEITFPHFRHYDQDIRLLNTSGGPSLLGVLQLQRGKGVANIAGRPLSPPQTKEIRLKPPPAYFGTALKFGRDCAFGSPVMKAQKYMQTALIHGQSRFCRPTHGIRAAFVVATWLCVCHVDVLCPND